MESKLQSVSEYNNNFASFQLDARKRNPTDGRIIKKMKVLRNQASPSISAIYFSILSMVL